MMIRTLNLPMNSISTLSSLLSHIRSPYVRKIYLPLRGTSLILHSQTFSLCQSLRSTLGRMTLNSMSNIVATRWTCAGRMKPISEYNSQAPQVAQCLDGSTYYHITVFTFSIPHPTLIASFLLSNKCNHHHLPYHHRRRLYRFITPPSPYALSPRLLSQPITSPSSHIPSPQRQPLLPPPLHHHLSIIHHRCHHYHLYSITFNAFATTSSAHFFCHHYTTLHLLLWPLPYPLPSIHQHHYHCRLCTFHLHRYCQFHHTSTSTYIYVSIKILIYL